MPDAFDNGTFMTYTARTYDSIDSAPAADWQRVHAAVGDRFTEPEFIRAVESTIGKLTNTAVAIVYDAASQPAAIATLSIVRLDVTMEATPFWRRTVAKVRRLWPNFLRLNVAMLGLPATFEQQKLCLMPSADGAAVLQALDVELAAFARRHGSSVMISGDFFAADDAWLASLTKLGYARGGSYPTHYLELDYPDFESYLAAMRSTYRTDIQNDRKLLDLERVRIEELDPAAMASAPISEQLYSYYLQLLGRVDFHLLTLPRSFFNEYLAACGRHLRAAIAYVDDRPAGFSIGIEMESMYRLLLIVTDEELSRRYGLYRNLYFRQIDYALKQGYRRISLGTTADEFKLRIGSTPYEQILYARATGLLKWPLRWFSQQLIPRVEPPAAKNVFRSKPCTTAPGTRRSGGTATRKAA